MAKFFRKTIDQQQFNGSLSQLNEERARFKQNQVSGIFEIQAQSDELQVLVLADGEETGAYCLYPNSRVKIQPQEIGTGWSKEEVPIRSAALPDHASRAIWQALEYQIRAEKDISGLAGWKEFLDACYKEKFTGMVGVTSDLCDGFVTLQEGLPVMGESIFCLPEGFTNNLPSAEAFMDAPDHLTVYSANPGTQAYQCSLLRIGVAGWGKRILANYKDMVGHKLLNILNSNLNTRLMHQQSNIYLTDIDIVDNHFFCESKVAAKVYQTLLLDMSQLIGRVIGGMVTRRIMHNTFERLAQNERDILTANTLAPAAFLR